MSHQAIAEMIRARSLGSFEDAGCDLVVCFSEHEAELLRSRPELAKRERVETQHLEPCLVFFFPRPAPPSAAPTDLGLLGRRIPVNRDMSPTSGWW